MKNNVVRMPPLNALRAFSAVMRHRSFKDAADELLVSPQAISQQIQLLESVIEKKLFHRTGRVVEPNEEALLLALYTQPAFDGIAEGIRRVSKAGAQSRVNLNVSPYFATSFLFSRLERIQNDIPGLDLRLTTKIELPDFVSDDVDVAIQWGFGSWDNNRSTLLLRDYKQICCTPDIARQIGSPVDLLSVSLLQPVLADRLWPNILRHLGISGSHTSGKIRIFDAATMRRATLNGLGVGLISLIDADEDLNSGKLVAPLGMNAMSSLPEDQVPGFYLVRPRVHRRIGAIAEFCSWVENEDWSPL